MSSSSTARTIAIVVTTLVSYTWTVASSQSSASASGRISPTLPEPIGRRPATTRVWRRTSTVAQVSRIDHGRHHSSTVFHSLAVALISANGSPSSSARPEHFSLLCQLPEMHLKHGPSTPRSCGWEFSTPSAPFSVSHSSPDRCPTARNVRALTILPTEGSKAPPFVAENRVAPLLMYAMLGLPLLFPAVLEVIPRAAINGVLAYVGVEGILTTQLFSRTLLLLSPPASFPKPLAALGVGRVHTYTLLTTLLGSAGLSTSRLPRPRRRLHHRVPVPSAPNPALVFTADELAALD